MSTSRKKETAIGAAVALAATASVTGAAQAEDITVTNTNDSGLGSLRNAIPQASASGDDRIIFKSGLSGDISLQSDLPPLTSPAKIIGPGGNRLSVNGNGDFAVFEVHANAIISGLTIQNGFRGEPYQPPPPPCSSRCGNYDYNYDPLAGGVQILDGANVTLRSDRFENNYGKMGGAVAAGGSSDVRVRNSEFTANTSGDSGGAIFANGASAHISGSDFAHNTSVKRGGAVYLNGPAVEVRGSTFTGNTAGSSGGGAFLTGQDSAALVSGSWFKENSASNGGGASVGGAFNVKTSTFRQNKARDSGGGLLVTPTSRGAGQQGTVSQSTVSGNVAGSNDTSECSSCYGNAGSGGGIRVEGVFDPSEVVLRNLTVAGNTTKYSSGGGISSDSPGLVIDSSTITGNEATFYKAPVTGGGLNQGTGEAFVTNSIIAGNTSYLGDIGTAAQGNHSRNTGSLTIDFSLIGYSGYTPFKTTAPKSNLKRVNPKLGKLADNGGPVKTRLPLPGSPVINAGASKLGADARGLARPVRFGDVDRPGFNRANFADMGAVELQDSRFDFGKVLFDPSGVSRLQLRVRSRGKAVLIGSPTIARFSKIARSPKTIGLRVHPRGRALRELRRTGKTRVLAKVRFDTGTGKPRVKSKRVTIIRTHP